MPLKCHNLGQLLSSAVELDEEQAHDTVEFLLDPSVSDLEKENFLLFLSKRGLTADELAFFAKGFLQKSVKLPFQESWKDQPLFDCCGSGGGGLSLFNVSTAIAFVLSTLGVPVVKHGNRGITKVSGSADVLEKLGIAYRLPPEGLYSSLMELGFAFIFAPDYHPCFARLAPVRKKLAEKKVQTLFHFLGPLLNPARPKTQLTGVFKEEHIDLFEGAFRRLGVEKPVVVYGVDEQYNPIGEIGVEGRGKARGLSLETLRPILTKNAIQRGYFSGSINDVIVDCALESASLIEAIFKGEIKGYARGLVVANSFLGLLSWGWDGRLEDALESIEQAIDSGMVYKKLTQARRFALGWRKECP
ncbi:anthranilate phosphoribosyltransferase [Methylacidiphilum caldifontis]|uniref:Anthranilate phosphoribosyltransferase n=1 Tax=Methylacidiphilum caldifontis TaxID=2795386 RepID=A0A4Y8P7R7_9BACT|nr:anthranilate phosphoribosyltransferase [Methylacidiphilum caldifontis]QSR88625.1 anthranilate phosphoribosyltransferase [Methylacidiphilum caldifontis]TFE66543.1 anthranilate phosphoribosyltransferase [Methylacidiphilum caldifontis]